MRTAYLDTLQILSTENRCSEFYGGPQIAVTVLNDFVSHMAYGYLPFQVSFEMSGVGTRIQDLRTGRTYRRFDKMMVNYNGSFFKGLRLDFAKTPRVGSFAPNTRPARALILLHELGHMIQAREGGWLLRDDGREPNLSSRNTTLIEKECREQLHELDKQVLAH